MSFFSKQSILALPLLILTACGSSGGSTTAATCSGDNITTACTSSYKVTFEATSQMVGKSTFTVRVADMADAPVSGATLTVTPWMRMETMEHGSVVDTVVDNGDGSYTATVYYLMSSMMNGVPMGTWDMKVAVNDEETTFSPVDVAMPMGQTVRVTLKRNEDTIASMTGPEARSWMLFKESCTSAGMMKLVVAARESLSSHPKVSTGSTLTDASGSAWSVDSIVVELSTDLATWHTATENGDGHYTVSGLTGLTDGVASDIYVKLTVNGYPYTTDGDGVTGSNEYQTFVVIPGSMSTSM